MTTENEQTTNTEKTIEPGDLTKLLEEYRGIAHLDVSQIADTLCLTPTAIKSLESEAFDKLPEPPYVRGYLRNYARLADQDPKHITRVYDILRGATLDDDNGHMGANLTASNSYQEVANPLITPQRFRLALLAGLLLLSGFLTMIPGVKDWADNVWSNFSTPSSTEEAVEVNANTQNSLNLPSLTDDVPGNLPISPDETEDTASNNNDTSTSSEKTETTNASDTTDSSEQEEATSDLPADNAQTTDSNTDNDNDANNDNTSDTSTVAATTTDTSATNVNIADQGQASESEQEDGNTNLKFVFEKEVWLRINGEDGSVVYEALHPAGTEKILRLNSPLKLKVGNAPAMQLFVNGAEMDTTEFTKGSVARFGIE